MSQQIKGLVITFEESHSEEYIAEFVKAVKFMRGVVSVDSVQGDVHETRNEHEECSTMRTSDPLVSGAYSTPSIDFATRLGDGWLLWRWR